MLHKIDVPAFVEIRGKAIPFTSYSEISKQYLELCSLHNCGAGCSPRSADPSYNLAPTPFFKTASGETIAYMSPNGRVWPGNDPKKWAPGMVSIFTPGESEQ